MNQYDATCAKILCDLIHEGMKSGSVCRDTKIWDLEHPDLAGDAAAFDGARVTWRFRSDFLCFS